MCPQRINSLNLVETMVYLLSFIIELVDSEEKINAFIPLLDEMVSEGLITLESVNVIMYRA